MTRLLQFAAALAVVLVPAWGADQAAAKEPAKPPAKSPAKATPKIPNANANAKSGRGAAANPRGGNVKGPPVIPKAPRPQLQRFLRMTPQEREIFIDKMPVPQQEALRKAAENWEALPQEERDRRLRLFDCLSKLPKDKQDLVDQRLTEFAQLPIARRVMIRNAYQRLSELPEADRQEWLDRPEFKERFTPIEQQIVKDLVTYYPNPQIQ